MIIKDGRTHQNFEDNEDRDNCDEDAMRMVRIKIILMRMVKLKITLMRMVTMNANRSWDAVKGVALDQTTDHADYVQVR